MVPLVAFSVLGGSSEVVTQVRDLNPGMLTHSTARHSLVSFR